MDPIGATSTRLTLTGTVESEAALRCCARPGRVGRVREPCVSVQIAVLVVLGPLGGELERQAFVRDLVDPDPR